MLAQVVKNLPTMWNLTPGLGRSPGKGNGNPPKYSCLEKSMDRGAWQATGHGVATSPTREHSTAWSQSYFKSWKMILWKCFTQFGPVAQACPSLCDPMNCSTPGLPVHHQLSEFTQVMSIELVMPPSHLILCCPLLLLPPIPPNIRVFSNESNLHMRWPKYWSFSFSISPSKEIPGLISSKWTGWISLQSKGLSRVFSNTTVQKHQFFGAQPSSQSNSHIHTWLLEKP